MKVLAFTNCNYSSAQRASLFQLLIAAIAVAFLRSSTADAIEFKGMSYVAWSANGFLTEGSDASLAGAKAAGCEWIALCFSWFQDDVNSTLIGPDPTSPTTESVAHAIRKCHELGMKVMLKPHVECRDGTWCGFINPSPAWFAAYQDFINFWAKIAQDNGAELLCIGAELANTTNQSLPWINITQNIHQYYSGPLTYGANPDEELNINWWNEVNYIGIDAYYPLTDQNDPTKEQLNAAWSSRADAIENWRNSNWPDMQIIFTEVGYRSVDGVNRAPWLKPSVPYNIDLQEQADCYDALLSQCKQRGWWAGVFWWNWEVDPNAGGLDDPFYTPQNKPAETVIVNYYVRLKGDFNCDYRVDYDDFIKIADYWLSYHPHVDIYPAPAGDGIIDFRDLAVFTGNWMVNLSIVGDINEDLTVDFWDLSRLAGQWLRTCEPGSIPEDINGDGVVNFDDFALLAENWRQASPP